MSYNKKKCIVRDSKDIVYEFYIYNKNLVLEDNMGQRVIQEDILDYALDIDKNDKIHIVCFHRKGKLGYRIFNDANKEREIFTMNHRYFLIGLKIKVMDSNIHIFYQIDSLKENNRYIYHNYLVEGNWKDEKLAETFCPRYISSYFIDYYGSDIYVLYCKSYNLGEYNIKRFNTNQNTWEDFQRDILIRDSSSLSFFITPNNMGIVCFSKSQGNNIQTFVKYKDFNQLSTSWSLDINVSNNDTNALKPIVFYKDNFIYVTWKQDNKIVCKKSSDLLNWAEELLLDDKPEDMYSLAYLSNAYECTSFKINYIYSTHMEFFYPLIKSKLERVENILSRDTLSEKNTEPIDDEINSIEKKHNEIMEEKDNYIKKLLNYIKIKDKRIEYLREVNSNLKKQINMLYSSISEYEGKTENFKEKQSLNNEEYSKVINCYENEIEKLRGEKENILEHMNRKIWNLLKVTGEKDDIIKKLLKR